MSHTIRDTVILGSGAAGLTAGIYTARANLRPLILEGHEPADSSPSLCWSRTVLDGLKASRGKLIENMKRQASRFGAEFRKGHLVSVEIVSVGRFYALINIDRLQEVNGSKSSDFRYMFSFRAVAGNTDGVQESERKQKQAFPMKKAIRQGPATCLS